MDFIKKSNDETQEVKQVESRVPGWFKKPWQRNATILIKYIELASKYTTVTVGMLKGNCPEIFAGNFDQMKSISEHNHGKVFEVQSNEVELWAPVKEYILNEYQQSLPLDGFYRTYWYFNKKYANSL